MAVVVVIRVGEVVACARVFALAGLGPDDESEVEGVAVGGTVEGGGLAAAGVEGEVEAGLVGLRSEETGRGESAKVGGAGRAEGGTCRSGCWEGRGV